MSLTKKSSRRWVASLDMYRKVPVDLLEGSRQGSVLSWTALLLMGSLFYMETKKFLSTKLVTDLQLDRQDFKLDPKTNVQVRKKDDHSLGTIRVNFNITMLDLKCDYATIDVVSVLGKEQNVTSNIKKWTVDADGIKQRMINRNMDQHDIILADEKVTQTLEELHEEHGEEAISLDPKTFEYAKNENEYLFVDFYASWCSHCQHLAPTWETLASVMFDAAEKSLKEKHGPIVEDTYSDEEYANALKVELPVMVAKIDCVTYHSTCMANGITGYPTLRLFIDSNPIEDYYGHRTVLALTEYLAHAEERHKQNLNNGNSMAVRAREMMMHRMNITDEERMWAEAMEKTRHHQAKQWVDDDHPGCQLSGHIDIGRVPGNFFIQARSKAHDLVPAMTNVSHEIHHLSFGDTKLITHLSKQQHLLFPGKFQKSVQPMDGNVYITKNLHEAYHHYIKLVPTKFSDQLSQWGKIWGLLQYHSVYQVLESSELAYYNSDVVPEAKFIIDLSPIAVSYRLVETKWYTYLTSLMAIIGGTFTVMGILQGSLRAVSKVTSKHRPYRPIEPVIQQQQPKQ